PVVSRRLVQTCQDALPSPDARAPRVVLPGGTAGASLHERIGNGGPLESKAGGWLGSAPSERYAMFREATYKHFPSPIEQGTHTGCDPWPPRLCIHELHRHPRLLLDAEYRQGRSVPAVAPYRRPLQIRPPLIDRCLIEGGAGRRTCRRS